MNIAVISNGTFNEDYYKEYFNNCDDTELICVCSTDDELPADEKIDIIAVDYYNQNINRERILYFSEQHPECLVIILADIDINTDNFKKEEAILRNFKVEYSSCYNIKNTDADSFYEFAKIMIETKTNDENAEAPFSTSVCLWVLAIVALIILGLVHYLH